MATQCVLHDDISGDVVSKSETFYLKYKGANGNEVYGLFEQFKTDGVDMSKLDYLLMQKRKSFYQLEKKKGLNVHVTGLIFTEKS